MSTQPDMILQFAKLLEEDYMEKGIENPEVRAEVWVSLNGQGSRLLIDPYTDLTECDYRPGHNDWIVPNDSIITFRDFKTQKLAQSVR